MPTQTPPAADWRAARLYLTAVHETGRRFIAAQICLGWELQNLKDAHGFGRGNNQHSRMGQVGPSSWEDLVSCHLGIPKRTADRFIQVFQGFQARLSKRLLTTVSAAIDDTPRKLGSDDAETLLQTLCKPPETLTQKERDAIEKAIITASDGATQSALLAELRLIKPLHIERGAGDPEMPDPGEADPDPSEEEMAEQLAFAFFHPVHELGSLRATGDFERRLNSLPLVTDDPAKPCLVRMRDDLAAFLGEVESTIQAKSRS